MIDLSITEAESCYNFSISDDLVPDGLINNMKKKLNANFSYEWIPVKKKSNENYYFPEDYKLLKNGYDISAIY